MTDRNPACTAGGSAIPSEKKTTVLRPGIALSPPTTARSELTVKEPPASLSKPSHVRSIRICILIAAVRAAETAFAAMLGMPAPAPATPTSARETAVSMARSLARLPPEVPAPPLRSALSKAARICARSVVNDSTVRRPPSTAKTPATSPATYPLSA